MKIFFFLLFLTTLVFSTFAGRSLTLEVIPSEVKVFVNNRYRTTITDNIGSIDLDTGKQTLRIEKEDYTTKIINLEVPDVYYKYMKVELIKLGIKENHSGLQLPIPSSLPSILIGSLIGFAGAGLIGTASGVDEMGSFVIIGTILGGVSAWLFNKK